MRRHIPLSYIFILLFSATFIFGAELPQGFVYLDTIVPGIPVDLRYAGHNNFIGQPIDGYRGKRCIMTSAAALALKKAQSELQRFGLSLKIYDAYRPQRAVNHFIQWARDTMDVKMKKKYYPHVRKSQLFKKGYIATRSGHSRGSTVDLTLIDLASGAELDMGTHFDFMDVKSHVLFKGITYRQRANRMLLNRVMREAGFKPYRNEWWHFTLKNEPFPNKYFDFVVP